MKEDLSARKRILLGVSVAVTLEACILELLLSILDRIINAPD